MAEDLENVSVGHYRSLDLPKNLAIRVKLKKVTAASAIPVARVGSTAESLRNEDEDGHEATEMGRVSAREQKKTPDTEEVIIHWQEKYFSEREEEFYSDRQNCYSILQEKYHQDIVDFRRKGGRQNKKIFTYVDNDDYANNEEVCKSMTTDPNELPHYLTNNMALVRRRNIDRMSRKYRTVNYGQRTNIVVDNQKETTRRNNHLISTPFKIMYIMADLSLEDRIGTLDDEYILCTVKIDGTGQIIFKPDLKISNNSPYRIQTIGDLKEVYEYTLTNASQEMTRDEKEQEIKSYDELYNRHAMYLASQVGSDFNPLPQFGVLNTSVFGEIVSAQDFEYDGLYIHFFLELPRYWSSQESPHLSGVTQTCFTKPTEKSNMAHFSFPFEFHVCYQPSESDNEDFIRWPTLFLEVLSVDQWERFRTEGYGYVTLPNKAGTHEMTVTTWRPIGNGLVPRMRRFFIGGSPELEDATFVKQPAGSEEHKVLSKFGFKTATSGSVKIKLNILHQCQDFMEKQKSKRKTRTMLDGIRGFGVMESLAQVLDAFQRARKRMQTARDTLPTVR